MRASNQASMTSVSTINVSCPSYALVITRCMSTTVAVRTRTILMYFLCSVQDARKNSMIRGSCQKINPQLEGVSSREILLHLTALVDLGRAGT